MTSKLTITDERLAELVAFKPLPGTDINSATRDEWMAMAAELQERRKAERESEPVAWRWRWSDDVEGYWRYTEEPRETRGSVTVQALYRHAQPGSVVDNEPYGFTDGDRRGMIYEPQYADRLNSPLPVYRHAQPAPDNRAITQHFDTIALETARGILCDVNRRHEFLGGEVQLLSRIQCRIDAACRAAMLQSAHVVRDLATPADPQVAEYEQSVLQAGNSPVIPEGYVMVPMRLTAENGAKGALACEFSETKFVNCTECFLSHDFGDDECETCDGSGRIEIKVPVSWTTIKEIWAKGVAHFAADPQEVK